MNGSEKTGTIDMVERWAELNQNEKRRGEGKRGEKRGEDGNKMNCLSLRKLYCLVCISSSLFTKTNVKRNWFILSIDLKSSGPMRQSFIPFQSANQSITPSNTNTHVTSYWLSHGGYERGESKIDTTISKIRTQIFMSLVSSLQVLRRAQSGNILFISLHVISFQFIGL